MSFPKPRDDENAKNKRLLQKNICIGQLLSFLLLKWLYLKQSLAQDRFKNHGFMIRNMAHTYLAISLQLIFFLLRADVYELTVDEQIGRLPNRNDEGGMANCSKAVFSCVICQCQMILKGACNGFCVAHLLR